MNPALGVVAEKSFTNPRSSRFSPMLAYSILRVLHFTLSSVIHRELIFMTSARSVSRFVFFGMWMSIVLAPSVEDTVLSPLYGLGSFVKSSVGRIYVGLFPGSLFRSLDRFIARCLGALTAAASAASQQVSELGSGPRPRHVVF